MTELPRPLVDAGWLIANVGHSHLRVVDCRFDLANPPAGRSMFIAGHIPGAVYLSLDDDLSAKDGPGRHPLPTPDAFGRTIGACGIGNDDSVVVYDNAGGGLAARLWWMLRSLGHKDVAVLNGGWAAWQRIGGPVEAGDTSPEPSALSVPDSWSGIVGRTALERRIGEVSLIDARAAERYRGDAEPLDPIAGHIPGAHNIPWSENLDAEGLMLDADALARRFAGAGDEIVVYCGSGVTACHNLLAMDAAGLDGGVLYPGSWSDWCTSGGEVALGGEPGVPTR